MLTPNKSTRISKRIRKNSSTTGGLDGGEQLLGTPTDGGGWGVNNLGTIDILDELAKDSSCKDAKGT